MTETHTHDVTTREGVIALYDAAFEEVYACAARLTRGQAVLAEDLTQDAFVQLVRAARDGTVTAVGVGWLITTVRRRFIDRLRSTDRERARLELVHSREPSSTVDAWAAASPSFDVLDGLTEREQAALLLRYVEDLSVAEVADAMSTSVRATESLLQRAKRKARRTYDEGRSAS